MTGGGVASLERRKSTVATKHHAAQPADTYDATQPATDTATTTIHVLHPLHAVRSDGHTASTTKTVAMAPPVVIQQQHQQHHQQSADLKRNTAAYWKSVLYADMVSPSDKRLGGGVADSAVHANIHDLQLRMDQLNMELLVKIGKEPSNQQPATADHEQQQSNSRQRRQRQSVSVAYAARLAASPPQTRKSTRAIAAEVQERVRLYETNPAEMEALMQRIDGYKSQDQFLQSNNAIVQRNIALVAQKRVEMKARLAVSKQQEHEQHRKQVLDAKMEHDAELLRQRELELQRKEVRMKEMKHQRQQQALHDAQLEFYNKWYILILLGSRIHAIQHTLLWDQQYEMTRIQHYTAARLIQTAWRRYSQKCREHKQKLALNVLGRAFRFFLPRLRLKMRHRAATIIIDTLREVHNTSRLLKVIQQYRYNVILCQKLVKRYLSVRQAQLQLLDMQWDKFVPIWWQSRTHADESHKQRKSKSAKSAARRASAGGAVYQIPTEIKERLLKQTFSTNRHAHQKKYEPAHKMLAAWHQEFRKRKDTINKLMGAGGGVESLAAILKAINDEMGAGGGGPLLINGKTGMPYVPSFNPMLKHDDMIALIERGFLEATGHLQQQTKE